MASGFGAFEPHLRGWIEDMRALKAQRDAATRSAFSSDQPDRPPVHRGQNLDDRG
jgi:hypothetical protein